MNSQEQYETEKAEKALEKFVPEYNIQRAEAIYKILKNENVHRVLDVGCGLGKVTVHLAKRGMDVTGVDISPDLIYLAKEKALKNNVNVKFILGELNKVEFKKKFDAVLFAGVLEHVEDEVSMMNAAKKSIKKNGKIVVFDLSTFDFLYSPRDKRIGHTKRYSKALSHRLLSEAGYSDIKLIYYNFLMLFGSLYLWIFKKEEYPYSALNPQLNKLIGLWYKHIENRFIFPIGDRIIAIGTNRD